jgi:hypothetical protein
MTKATLTTYTGADANFYISGEGYTDYGATDISITIDRDVIEQPLACQDGNFYKAGSISVDISFTASKFASGDAGALIASMINKNTKGIEVSGNCGTNSLYFHFKSAMITDFSIDIGDADTFTTGTFDMRLHHPYKITEISKVADGTTGTMVKDY